jgi:hypothetical protein
MYLQLKLYLSVCLFVRAPVCHSVRQSVSPSVGQSVGRSELFGEDQVVELRKLFWYVQGLDASRPGHPGQQRKG